jgi:hypothetical protein
MQVLFLATGEELVERNKVSPLFGRELRPGTAVARKYTRESDSRAQGCPKSVGGR